MDHAAAARPVHGGHRARRRAASAFGLAGSDLFAAVLTLVLAVGAAVALIHRVSASSDVVAGRPAGHGIPAAPTSTSTGQSPTTTARPAPTPPAVQALVSWAATNLEHGTRMMAGPDATSALSGAGFVVASGWSGCRQANLVLVTAATRREATDDPELAACLAASLPVAVTGTGVDAAELRQVYSDPAAAATDRRTALARQRMGGAALAGNSAISMPPAVRSDLLAGRLDLRAETVLAVLSQQAPLRLKEIHAEPAEERAGLPSRQIEIRLAEPALLTRVLAGLAGTYQPSTTTTAAGATTLRWPFRTTPIPVVRWTNGRR